MGHDLGTRPFCKTNILHMSHLMFYSFIPLPPSFLLSTRYDVPSDSISFPLLVSYSVNRQLGSKFRTYNKDRYDMGWHQSRGEGGLDI